MKAAFVYAGNRQRRLDAQRAGRAPSEFFYGAIEFEPLGWEVGIFDAPERHIRPWTQLYNQIFAAITPVRTRGEHFAAPLPILDALREFDVIVATSTSLALALGWWKRVGRCKPPIVGIHCGLVNYPVHGIRLTTTCAALRNAHCVVFAEPELPEMLRSLGLSASHVHVDPFGVDVDFWTPAKSPTEEFFLSVGNDGRRDYATLIAAARRLDIRVKIVTSRTLPGLLPPNVEHVRSSWHQPALSDEELRDEYRRAIAVVVPLEDSIQPSGQSVSLQAMACGKPVILSRTRGLWTGNCFPENETLLVVPAESSTALTTAMQHMLAAPNLRHSMGVNARAAVLTHGTIKAFAARLARICESVVRNPKS